MTPDPKPKSYRNADYLKFIRSKLCLICHRKAVAAHVRDLAFGGGTGLKPPDYCSVPLCVTHHNHLDTEHVKDFEFLHNIDLKLEIIRLMMEYIESKRKKTCCPHRIGRECGNSGGSINSGTPQQSERIFLP